MKASKKSFTDAVLKGGVKRAGYNFFQGNRSEGGKWRTEDPVVANNRAYAAGSKVLAGHKDPNDDHVLLTKNATKYAKPYKLIVDDFHLHGRQRKY